MENQQTSNAKKASLSLIIAVYKRPEALEMIFHALQRQVFTDFEIVVADDGSGDEIHTLINEWQGKFRYPIKHIWHEDKGFRKTIIINQAVAHANGEYLVSIDGDCIPHRLFLQDHWDRKAKGSVLAGRRVMMTESATSQFSISDITSGKFESQFQWLFGKGTKRTKQYAIRSKLVDTYRNKQRQNYFVLGSNFSLFREDFLALNGYDERIIGRGMEDNNLHARMIAAGMPIYSISQIALQYHLYHNADPIPHDKETVKEFCTVTSGWAEFGLKKSDES